MTFEPRDVPRWARQEVKGRATSVNEAGCIRVIVRAVEPGVRRRRLGVGVVVMRGRCSVHGGNEVSPCVGGVAERRLRICVHSGLVEAVWFLWDCLWDSGGLPVVSQRLAEDAGPWRT